MQMAATTPGGRILVDGRPMTGKAAPNITVSGCEMDAGRRGNRRNLHAALKERSGTQTPAEVETAFEQLPLTFPAPEMSLMLKEAAGGASATDLACIGIVGSGRHACRPWKRFGRPSSMGRAAGALRARRWSHGGSICPRSRALGIVVVQNPTHLAALKQIYGGEFVRLQPSESLCSMPAFPWPWDPTGPSIRTSISCSHRCIPTGLRRPSPASKRSLPTRQALRTRNSRKKVKARWSRANSLIWPSCRKIFSRCRRRNCRRRNPCSPWWAEKSSISRRRLASLPANGRTWSTG